LKHYPIHQCICEFSADRPIADSVSFNVAVRKVVNAPRIAFLSFKDYQEENLTFNFLTFNKVKISLFFLCAFYFPFLFLLDSVPVRLWVMSSWLCISGMNQYLCFSTAAQQAAQLISVVSTFSLLL